MRRHLLAASVFLLACIGMATTWQTPWVWAVLSSTLLLVLVITRDRRDLAFFALGIGIGGFIDVLQTGAGVTVYHRPGVVLLFPEFVLLYWGMAGVALRRLFLCFPKAEAHPADLGLFVGSVLLSLFGNAAPRGVAVLMLLALGLHLALVRRKGDLLAALLLLVLGPLTESVLIHQGLYHFPSAGGQLIALWLYPLYACVGASLRGLMAWFESGVSRAQPSVQAASPAPGTEKAR